MHPTTFQDPAFENALPGLFRDLADAAPDDPTIGDTVRRRARRRRAARVSGGIAGTATGLAAAVALAAGGIPSVGVPTQPNVSAAAGGGISFGGLSIDPLQGWTATEVDAFDACTAKPRTIYLAKTWQRLEKNPPPTPNTPPGGTPPDQGLRCTIPEGPWMTVVKGPLQEEVQGGLVFGNGTTLEVDEHPYQGVFNYQPFLISNAKAAAAADAVKRNLAYSFKPMSKAEWEASFVTTVHIAGAPTVRKDLLEQITWPTEPSAPASGGLALPDRIDAAGTDPGESIVNPEGDSINRPALDQIRAALADLPAVPRGQECDLIKPNMYGFSLVGPREPSAEHVRIFIGDRTCPQAVSNRGGRVAVPDDLGKRIYDLIMTNPR